MSAIDIAQSLEYLPLRECVLQMPLKALRGLSRLAFQAFHPLCVLVDAFRSTRQPQIMAGEFVHIDDPTKLLKHVDPLCTITSDFPYRSLDSEMVDTCGRLQQADLEILEEALRAITTWLAAPRNMRGNPNRAIATRTIAFAWMLRPSLFEGSSLRSLAQKMSVDEKVLRQHAKIVGSMFRLRNRAQRKAGYIATRAKP